jgi:hypothetical protein
MFLLNAIYSNSFITIIPVFYDLKSVSSLGQSHQGEQQHACGT